MKLKKIFDWIRYSIQVKITLPYVLLSLIAALGGGLIITEFIVQSIDERLVGSLIETGTISKEIIVEEENLMLESLRLVTYLTGIDQLIIDEDAEGLREIILPIAFNNNEDAVEVLNTSGVSLLSIRRDENSDQGEYRYSKWSDRFSKTDVVQKILVGESDEHGDKYSALIEIDEQEYLYVAGPIKDANNNLIGIIMVGNLVKDLLTEVRKETVAQVTVYEFDGKVISSTFASPVELNDTLANELLEKQDQESLIRDFSLLDISYREAISVWEIRRNHKVGLIGVAFSTNFLSETSQKTRLNVFGLVSIVLFMIIITGIYIARMITSPIETLKSAAVAVSEGDLEVQVDPIGHDEVALLTRTFNEMVSNVKESKAELINAYDRTLEGWSKALELRDRETEGHTQRVTEMTVELASRYGIDGTKIENIRRGALLHDIGKVGVPDCILHKTGKLTNQEFEVMKKHTSYAYEMLSKISFLAPAIDIPYCHHEKWDGSGYPNGLKGRSIPLAARIFSIVDVWDAITTDRVYRKAMSLEDAIKVIEDGRGKHFDPDLVDEFLALIEENKNE